MFTALFFTLIPASALPSTFSGSGVVASILFGGPGTGQAATLLTPWWVAIPLNVAAITFAMWWATHKYQRKFAQYLTTTFLTATIIGIWFGWFPALIPATLMAIWWLLTPKGRRQ